MLSALLLVAAALLFVGVLPIVIVTFRNRLPFFYGVGLAAVCVLLAFVAMVTAVNLGTGENLIEDAIRQTFEDMEAAIVSLPSETWEAMGVTGQQTQQLQGALKESLRMIRDTYTVLFPSIIITMVLALVYLFFMVLKNILRLFCKKVSAHPLFSELLLPRGVGVALLISFAGSALFSSRVGYAFLNVVVLILGIAACCGFSLLDFYLRRKVKFGLLRFLIYLVGFTALSAFSTILFYGFMFVALLDSLRDFRRLRSREDSHGEQQQ